MKRLELLDYGRFLAAIIVILFHYTFNGIVNGKISSIEHSSAIIDFTKYGYLGVELFFMISGYVIFFSARAGSAAKFAVGRAIRLYPSYWFAVLFTSLFALQWGGDLMSVHPGQVLFNLSMLQSYFGVMHVDGVYWTLVYEITFYSAVLLFLLCGLQKHLDTIFICWPVLLLVAGLVGGSKLPYLGGYYCYFAAGALFAVLRHDFRWPAVLSLVLAYALCVDYSAGKAATLTAQKGIEFSSLTIGLIVTAFFAFFVCQNTNKGQSLQLPWSRTFGALTYPIYLIHAHFGYMAISQFATEDNKVVVYVLTLLAVVAVAFFMHRVIEQKLAPLWKMLFNNVVGRPIDFVQNMALKTKAMYSKSLPDYP